MLSTAWSLLMLLVVLAAIPLALWAVKRLQTLQPGRGPRPLAVAAQLPLGARERVVLVRVQERLLVLGVTAQQITLLGEADPAAMPPAPAAPDFGSLLKQALGKK
ncbi:flagellar biosynthetic protein FliO [Ramlibacter sp. MMS24-I3-19]|uniref:flagellar biosynthetic protein FliO n=1 Tax=Ramlibacter sp. MMS24-I3-19 TaxID=3416606 RepID=UPI003D06C206